MANYNCTPSGCIQNNSGTFPDLQSCQSSCISWGCPPIVSANTKIYIIYDSGYQDQPYLESAVSGASAWISELQSNGWSGEHYHVLAGYGQEWLYWPTAVYMYDLVANGVLADTTRCFDITNYGSSSSAGAWEAQFHVFDRAPMVTGATNQNAWRCKPQCITEY